MKVDYFASSPKGDLRLEAEDLGASFRIRPDQTHPTLTLRDYLDAVRDFVLQQAAHPLCRILSERLHTPITPGDLQGIRLRTEKHGALYHVTCVEPVMDDRPCKLAVSTAISAPAQECLAREEKRLMDLDRRFGFPFLPVPLLSGEVSCGAPGKAQPVRMLLAEWFEDFHEWHLDSASEGAPPRVFLWDSVGGYRFATNAESRRLFHEIARVLTLYYDLDTFGQICSWHHAAGDFVVCTSTTPLQVRLTTVRDYQPLSGLSPEAGIQPLVAMVYFFLNLLVRMRVDRKAGVGKPLWAGEWAVEAASAGFFDTLEEMRNAGRSLPAGIEEIRGILRSFSSDEFLSLHETVLDFAPEEDPADRAWIADHLEEHVATLRDAVRNISV